MADKTFADGFSWKRRDSAPDFVVGNLAIKVEDAIPFLKTHSKNGWVNLNVMTSSAGKPYVELDTFVPKPREEVATPVAEKEADGDLPF